ncbi:hypothetical protein [Synechococcus sp. PCC 7336]|uniref:hypothetical protein n=1 Tax=Synechococcus sp. PCC 7336 TaxID=195250 RepID=UPI0003499D54|nr:hypothetical protein [Synechococcus sp. PCC 7336]
MSYPIDRIVPEVLDTKFLSVQQQREIANLLSRSQLEPEDYQLVQTLTQAIHRGSVQLATSARPSPQPKGRQVLAKPAEVAHRVLGNPPAGKPTAENSQGTVLETRLATLQAAIANLQKQLPKAIGYNTESIAKLHAKLTQVSQTVVRLSAENVSPSGSADIAQRTDRLEQQIAQLEDRLATSITRVRERLAALEERVNEKRLATLQLEAIARLRSEICCLRQGVVEHSMAADVSYLYGAIAQLEQSLGLKKYRLTEAIPPQQQRSLPQGRERSAETTPPTYLHDAYPVPVTANRT